jgi:hypothetical protein
VAEVKNTRRYYLHKRINARVYEGSDNAAVWQAKQEADPGTSLPSDFPLRDELAEIGYSTIEDLDGADVNELQQSGISTGDAETILAALATLL